jgi:hypothetical protein
LERVASTNLVGGAVFILAVEAQDETRKIKTKKVARMPILFIRTPP